MRLGIDPNAKNKIGETALTWALRRGYTPVVAALKKGGASDAPMIRESVEKALALLQKSGPEFVKVSGCTSCHHQSLPQMAIGAARARGFSVDEQISQQQVKAVLAMYKPMRELFLQGTNKFPDPPISVSYALAGLAAEGYAPDETTEAMAYLIGTTQLPDGSFGVIAARPPIEASPFTAAAMSIRALKAYGKEPEQKIAMARKWLEQAHPTDDRGPRHAVAWPDLGQGRSSTWATPHAPCWRPSARMVDGDSWRASKPTLTPPARSWSRSSFPDSCSLPIPPTSVASASYSGPS